MGARRVTNYESRAYAAAKFGVGGFAESLLKGIGPLGIKVTIIEPGGFRYAAAEKSTVDKLESDRKWKDFSLSTDYSFD